MLACKPEAKPEPTPTPNDQSNTVIDSSKLAPPVAPVIEKSAYQPPTGKFIGKKTGFTKAVIVTSLGEMSFELLPNEAPLATENFINLAKAGYYNGNQFLRVIPEFVVQAGDKSNTGFGDAGYYFETETHPDYSHDRLGVLSYANSGPSKNSSQFFITLSAQRHLDGKHPIFGLLISGEDVLKKIAAVKTGKNDRPLNPIEITSVRIE